MNLRGIPEPYNVMSYRSALDRPRITHMVVDTM